MYYIFNTFSVVLSNRRQNKAKEGTRSVPHIIVFVMGGVTYSEIRVGYELTDPNWKVLVGGSHTLTPDRFLEDLKGLSD